MYIAQSCYSNKTAGKGIRNENEKIKSTIYGSQCLASVLQSKCEKSRNPTGVRSYLDKK